MINPPQESRPEAAAIADFSKEYGLATAQAARAATDLQLPETRLRDTEIWTWLALALLVVAISENLLADRLRA